MRAMSNECSESRVVSGRFVLSCIVSLACLVGLLGWVDAARSAALSTETTTYDRTTQQFRNSGAFAALKSDGSVITWGNTRHGGNSTTPQSNVSIPPTGSLSSDVTRIFSNTYAFAALKTDGSVITWGDTAAGGDSSLVTGNLSSGVTRIFSTGAAFAALKTDGSVITWGNSTYGGDSSSVTSSLSSGVAWIATPFDTAWSLTTIKAGAGTGSITSDPSGVACTTTCSTIFDDETSVTLTATPTANSTFTGWSGACTGTSTCTVSMIEARTTTATFTPRPPPRTPRPVRWDLGTRTTNEPISGSFTATAGVTYRITATNNTTRSARGTCKVTINKKTNKRTAKCTIRFKHAGTWLVKITPTQYGINGTPATKTLKIRTPKPAGTAGPAQPVTG